MRIIKYGKPLPEKNIVCKACKSELAYTDADTHTYHAEWYHEIYVICPVCKGRIVIEHVSEGC